MQKVGSFFFFPTLFVVRKYLFNIINLQKNKKRPVEEASELVNQSNVLPPPSSFTK
jgi:hypothetical protein